MTAPAGPAKESPKQAPEAAAPAVGIGPAPGVPMSLAWTPEAPIHQLRPPNVPRLQGSVGNATLSRLLAARHGVQRAPTGGGAPAKPSGGSKALPFNSYVDLFNAFQEFGVALVNNKGAGLDGIRFGKDLAASHRSLLFDLKTVLKGSLAADADAKSKALSYWPSVAGRIQKALTEAQKVGLPSGPLAAVADTIGILNKRLARSKKQREATESESADTYATTVTAIEQLLIEFVYSHNRGGPEFIREEVAGRKDVEVNGEFKKNNAAARAKLAAVKLGPEAIGRHRALVESLRSTLIMARSEAPGSTFGALAGWRRLPGELQHVLQRAVPHLAMWEPTRATENIQKTGTLLMEQWQMVHQGSLGSVMTKERQPGQLKAARKVAKQIGGSYETAIKETLAIEDMQNTLDIIQNYMKPSDQHPGEWVIRKGGTEIRIHDWQAKGLHDAARGALTKYVVELVASLRRAQIDYEDIKRGTNKFKRSVLGFFGGADDPGDFSREINRLDIWRDKQAKPLIEAGRYVEVFKQILQELPGVELRIRAEAEYDADLDKGHRRLATTMSVVQVALVSLVPIAGEAALASLVIRGATVTGAGVSVGTTAIVAGSGGAALAETGKQLYQAEGSLTERVGQLDADKIAGAARTGAVIGGGAVAPVATRGLGGSIAKNLGTSEAFGQFGASTALGGIQSVAGGGSGFQGMAGGGLGFMGGKLVAPIANTPGLGRIAQGTVGAGVNALTGQDAIGGFAGGFVGSYAKAPPPQATKGTSGKGTGSGGAGAGGTPKPPPSGSADAALAPAIGADTLHGVGAQPPKAPAAPFKPPAPPGEPNVTTTRAGLGFDGRGPAVKTGATSSGMPAPGGPRAPAPPPGPAGTGDTSPGMPAPGGPKAPAPRRGQIDAVPDHTMAGPGFDGRRPANGSGPAPVPSKFAKLPEYAGQKPLWEESRIVARIEDPVQAKQLYDRVYREGQRKILHGTDEAVVEVMWVDDGGMGHGRPPAAWVREDGVVRFNLGKFDRPDFSDLHPTANFTPKPLPAGQRPTPLMYEELVRPVPRARPRPQGAYKVPGYAGRPPIYGADSKVAHVIADPSEASSLYALSKGASGGASVSHTTHDDSTVLAWEMVGGQGKPPPAWVRTDGVVHFNFAHIDHPDAAWARQYVKDQAATMPSAPGPGSGGGAGGGAGGGGGGGGAPGGGQTLIGQGFDGRGPATRTGATSRGMPAPGGPKAPAPPAGPIEAPDAPAPLEPIPSAPGKPVPAQPAAPAGPPTGAGGGTELSIAPAPRPGRQPGKPRAGSRFATLPEYRGRPPVVGKVTHVIAGPDEAIALYRRLHQEGQRNYLGTKDHDIEVQAWRGDAGAKGSQEPPLAWVREDGTVRFNFSKFQAPNLGGHTTEPFKPIDFKPAPVNQSPSSIPGGLEPYKPPMTMVGVGEVGPGTAPTPPAPAPGTPVTPPGPAKGGGGGTELSIPPTPRPEGQPVANPRPQTPVVKLAEYAGRRPVVGKVIGVIDTQAEAAALYTQLHKEGRANYLGTADRSTEQSEWHDYAGQNAGDAPMVWVRPDGAVRFNFSKFQRPNLGGHTTEPFAPIDFVPAPRNQTPTSIPGGLQPFDGLPAPIPPTPTELGMGAVGPAGDGGPPVPATPTVGPDTVPTTAPMPASGVTQQGIVSPRRVPAAPTPSAPPTTRSFGATLPTQPAMAIAPTQPEPVARTTSRGSGIGPRPPATGAPPTTESHGASSPTVPAEAVGPTQPHPATRPTVPAEAVAPTQPQTVARPTQPGYGPAPRPPAAPTPTPGSGGGSGGGPGGGSGGGPGQPVPSHGDAYHDPVAASQLAADHVLLGGETRLIGRGEGRRVWQQEYGGQGREPAAWFEPGGKLVLDSAQIPMPVRSADILQGPIRQGTLPQPPDAGGGPGPGTGPVSGMGPATRPTVPSLAVAPTEPQPVARPTQPGYGPAPRPPAPPAPGAGPGGRPGGGATAGPSRIVSETADIVQIDRSQPMASSGFAGATAQKAKYGAFEARIRLPDGTEVDAVVKILPQKRQGKDAGGFFAKEVEGARVAAQTGMGPDFYGVVHVGDGYGFAMAKVPGAFVENFAKPGSPGYVRAEAETQAARNALTDQTADDVRAFGKRLLDRGYYMDGEVQGLVGPDGRWRPIDFAGVKKLPPQGPDRVDALRAHGSMIESEAAGLETELAAVRTERGGAGGGPKRATTGPVTAVVPARAAPDDATSQMPAVAPAHGGTADPGDVTRPMKTVGQPKATGTIAAPDVPTLLDPTATVTAPTRPTQPGYGPAPRPPAAPTPTPGSGGGSGGGPGGGSGGGPGQPVPSHGDAYHDPVAASQLAADHVLLGGETRLIGRGEGRRVWQQEYGGQGREPAAWFEPGGKLVLDSAQIPMPVRSADILQGPIRQGTLPQPPDAGGGPGPGTGPVSGMGTGTSPGMPAPGGPRRPASRTGTSPGMPAPGGPKVPAVPTALQAAEVELGFAVMARAAADEKLTAARAATSAAKTDGDKLLLSTAEAGPAVDAARARVIELQAAQKVREARLAEAAHASEPDRARLAREAEEAKSDAGYAQVRLGEMEKQAVRAKRVADGIAVSRASDAARTKRRNVQPIEDPDEAARLFNEAQASGRGGIAMTNDRYQQQWKNAHDQKSPAPAGGWRKDDGTVVINKSNPRVKQEVERLALARKAASGGGGSGGAGGTTPRASDSGAIPVPIDDPNEAIPEPIDDQPSRPRARPTTRPDPAAPQHIEPELTGPIVTPKQVPDPAAPQRIEPEYARQPVKPPRVGAATVPAAPAPGPAAPTETADDQPGMKRRVNVNPLNALNATSPTILNYESEKVDEKAGGKTVSRTNAGVTGKGLEGGKEVTRRLKGGSTIGAGAHGSMDWSGNTSLVGSATFQSRSGLRISPNVGHSDQADASDPQYIEGVGFLVTFKISSTDSLGFGGGKGRVSVNVGKSKTDYQSGSKILKTLAQAIDFRDNVRARAERSIFMPPPTSVAGALAIPMGESRGGGTARATNLGGGLQYGGGLGDLGYTHTSTSNEEISVMKVGENVVDVTRTFSEDSSSDPHISGLGLSNTKGTGDDEGRAVTYRFDLATSNGTEAFKRWCAGPGEPGNGATNRRIKTFRSANAHDDYGFPVKFSASWKGRTYESKEVDEEGNITETFGGAQDRDTRTGWFARNVTRDKEQHANAQIEATLKNGQESYAARFTVSGKSGDSNLEELNKIFYGAQHDAGASSGYWLVTAQIDPAVVRDLMANSKRYRNAKTTAEKMRIYADRVKELGAGMLGGQVRAGAAGQQAWNLELPGDPNFPGATGRAELEDQHKGSREQLAEKKDTAGSVAENAKQTIAKLEKRKAAVADKKRYTDLPDELRQQQVDLVDQHIGKFKAVRSQSESLAMRNDPNEDVKDIRARAENKKGYDKVPPDQLEIKKLTDAVALKEQGIATFSKRVEAANVVLKRMMPNEVRFGDGVKGSVYQKFNSDAKTQRDIARTMDTRLKASAQEARDLRNQWSDAKDDPARLIALRALDAELKEQRNMVEIELDAVYAATRAAYVVTSDFGIGKDWDYFRAINCDGALRGLAINTASGDVPEDEVL